MKARTTLVAGLAIAAGAFWWLRRRQAVLPAAQIGFSDGTSCPVAAADPAAAELLVAAAALRRALEGDC